MNNSTASQYMDKQIMDLTNSQSSAAANSNNSGSNNDFIDFMNREPEKKEDIVPSYDFMPIRPAVRSSSPPATQTSNFDSGDDDAPLRTWNSVDSKSNSSPIRNYGAVDAEEPAKFMLGKNFKPSNVPMDVSLVSEIDRTMKKYVDNLTHAVDSMSARLSQLETRTRNLEHSIDDLKGSVADSHGSTDGKLRLLENILREVQSGVLLIKDKQDILDAQLQIGKLQIPKVEPEESKTNMHTDSIKTGLSANQQFSNIPPAQPPPTFPMPNAPPSPPQQNLPTQAQPPNPFPQNQLPSVPQRDSYFPSPGQTSENPSQQYQMPPLQPQHQPAPPPPQHQPTPPLQQHQPAPPPPQHQSAPPPQHQYQSLPPPQYPQSPTPSQPHPPFSAGNPSLPQPSSGHHTEDTPPYISPQTYPPAIRPPISHPPTGGPPPPSQQFYGPNTNMYEQSSRPGPGYSGSFAPSSGHVDPYPYSSSPSQFSSGSSMKPQQHPPGLGQGGGNSYPQLPTARILPQALPTASAVSGNSGPGGSGNRVPIDDVVDRVTNMGFPREQVRATVRKLTENGQAVDLNVVLDKLMNDGDGQAPRGWFGR